MKIISASWDPAGLFAGGNGSLMLREFLSLQQHLLGNSAPLVLSRLLTALQVRELQLLPGVARTTAMECPLAPLLSGTSAFRHLLEVPLVVDLQINHQWHLMVEEREYVCMCVGRTVKRNQSLLWAWTNGHRTLRNHMVKCNRSPQSTAGNDSLVNVLLTGIYRFNISLLQRFCCCAGCFISFLSCPEVH